MKNITDLQVIKTIFDAVISSDETIATELIDNGQTIDVSAVKLLSRIKEGTNVTIDNSVDGEITISVTIPELPDLSDIYDAIAILENIDIPENTDTPTDITSPNQTISVGGTAFNRTIDIVASKILEMVLPNIKQGTNVTVNRNTAGEITISSTNTNTDTATGISSSSLTIGGSGFSRTIELNKAGVYAQNKTILKAGTNITLANNDSNNEITISATNTIATLADIYNFARQILLAGSGISITQNANNNTLTIACTLTNTDTATNITADDNTIQISGSGFSRGIKANPYNIVNAVLQAGNNITITQNSQTGKITIASTGGVNTDTPTDIYAIDPSITVYGAGGFNVGLKVNWDFWDLVSNSDNFVQFVLDFINVCNNNAPATNITSPNGTIQVGGSGFNRTIDVVNSGGSSSGGGYAETLYVRGINEIMWHTPEQRHFVRRLVFSDNVPTSDLAQLKNVRTDDYNTVSALPNLEEIELRNQIISNYPNGMFEICQWLKAFTDNKTSVIPANAFRYCRNLERVQIGKQYAQYANAVERIGDYAFEGCSKLKYVMMQILNLEDIPAYNYYTVGMYAFRGTAIENINFLVNPMVMGAAGYPSMMENLFILAEGIFSECECLTDVWLPPDLLYNKQLPANFFYGCTNLHSISFRTYGATDRLINLQNMGCLAYLPSLRHLAVGYETAFSTNAFLLPNNTTKTQFISVYGCSAVYPDGRYMNPQQPNQIMIQFKEGVYYP